MINMLSDYYAWEYEPLDQFPSSELAEELNEILTPSTTLPFGI